ncbi:MAG: alpha/beta fold hydrolase [Gemmatimonadota bacterium]|nr:alpha/beta fold hydrolase [Gemmatimonadota bacterium]
MRFRSGVVLTGFLLGAAGGAMAQTSGRPPVAMDSARARALYVSNQHADHPASNYAAAVTAKAATDSIFAARSAGRMRYAKISYQSSADGLEVPAYLFGPLQPRTEGHAAMIWVHGGVHGNWDQNYLPFLLEAVERGYVVIAPDYRGSTGYGAEFHNLIDYGGKELNDVESAVDYLHTLPYVDRGRIGIMGWSHGGFITSHLLFRGADTRFRAGVAMVPVTNLIFRLSYKGPSYQRSFSTQKDLLGLPFEQRDEYVKRSPYYHIDKLEVPILVHVATNDTDVNFEEDRQMIDGLIARKPQLAETKIYWDPPVGPAGGGHTFNRRVNRQTLERDDSPEQIDSWNRVWAFFEWNLRPAGK